MRECIFEQLLPNEDIFYCEDFVRNTTTLFEKCANLPWKQEQMKAGNKLYDQKRLTCLLGSRTFRYSGITRYPSAEIPKFLELTLRRIQTACDALKENHPQLNAIFGNLYESGLNSIGSHSDDHDFANSYIASLSLGAERYFDFHSIHGGKRLHRQILKSGSLLLMGDGIQERYKHSVPVQSNVTESRINLTFRAFA